MKYDTPIHIQSREWSKIQNEHESTGTPLDQIINRDMKLEELGLISLV